MFKSVVACFLDRTHPGVGLSRFQASGGSRSLFAVSHGRSSLFCFGVEELSVQKSEAVENDFTADNCLLEVHIRVHENKVCLESRLQLPDLIIDSSYLCRDSGDHGHGISERNFQNIYKSD
jgi:hypothetical protein